MHRIIECFDSRHHDITVTQLRAVEEQCFLKERGQGQMIPELLYIKGPGSALLSSLIIPLVPLPRSNSPLA
ncbi:Uncharacterized protein HZ326_12160 [Fusarium oxysporum f. sp. albedinis]|nr:Uncharacterized protein HZ326_12160 [Fusarium oxysporum f. sp. albedinis]